MFYFKRYRTAVKVVLLLAGGCAAAAGPELVTVGDPGNPGNPIAFVGNLDLPRGSVDYKFRIGRNSVSNAEYAEFLNRCSGVADRYKLWDERMEITRSGSTFCAVPGREERPIRYVKRTAAARYCNDLTTGDTERGAYRIGMRPQLERNMVREVVITPRDLTTPDAGIVYFLPDMHEYYKAGWYVGDGGYRVVTAETARQPSRYGMVVPDGKPGDWMENKYYASVPVALGGVGLNTERFQSGRDDTGYEGIGFRVAATAPVQFGKKLNPRRNFFFAPEEKATLRIRSDADRVIEIQLEMRDYAGKRLWSGTVKKKLSTGITEFPVELPRQDGYYELLATCDGATARIPIAVFLDPVYSGPDGNFGAVCHLSRHEQRFSFDDYDLDLLVRCGCGIARVDFLDADRQLLERIHRAGLRIVMCFRSLRTMDGLQKWLRDDVAAMVAAHKDLIHDWEVGNEPTYWKCSGEDYAQILKEAFRVIRQLDPQSNVICGDMMAIHAQVFQNRGGDFCDSIAEHIYGFYLPEFWGFAGKMRELNGWKRAAGIFEKPVWMTEIGTTNYLSCYLVPVKTAEESRRYQMLSIPKQLTAALAFGASRVMPYNFRALPLDTQQEDFGLIDRDGFPKPAIAAFRTTAKLLGRARFSGFLKGHSFRSGKIVGLAFKDEAKRDVIVYWRNDLFSGGDFSRPLSAMIHPPEPVKLKATGNHVEFFDVAGARSELAVKDARSRSRSANIRFSCAAISNRIFSRSPRRVRIFRKCDSRTRGFGSFPSRTPRLRCR